MQTMRQLRSIETRPVEAAVCKAACRIVGDDWFRQSDADRMAYGRDCWQLGILWAREGEVRSLNPDFVVVPGSLDEVIQLVDLARESGTPLIPYGAGSGVCGGTLPVRGGFMVDTKRLDTLSELDREHLTIRAGAGAIGQNLETDLNRRGYTLGHYPASLYCSSLGGYLAARSAGQLSTRFGKIEDMCLSLQAVAGTGEVIETRRWQPDLTQIFIGSEGTLGIITEATLRVEPLPAYRISRGFSFKSLTAAWDAVREMMQGGFRPSVVRLYDTFDTLMALGKSLKRGQRRDLEPKGMVAELLSYASRRGATLMEPAWRRVTEELVQRVLGRPLVLNRVVDALPIGSLLIVGFEGDPVLTPPEAQAAFEILERSGEDQGSEPGEHWYRNRFAVSYKQSQIMDYGAFVDTMEVSTTWDNLHNLYRSVKQAVSPLAFIMAHFSHVYAEGSSIYFTFAGFAPEGEPIEELYGRTWDAALDAVRRSSSNITHHHGAGILKAGFLSHDHFGGARLDELLKDRFDPKRIMNPGKLWDQPQREPDRS